MLICCLAAVMPMATGKYSADSLLCQVLTSAR
jgi:hypothetical protein